MALSSAFGLRAQPFAESRCDRHKLRNRKMTEDELSKERAALQRKALTVGEPIKNKVAPDLTKAAHGAGLSEALVQHGRDPVHAPRRIQNRKMHLATLPSSGNECSESHVRGSESFRKAKHTHGVSMVEGLASSDPGSGFQWQVVGRFHV